MAAETVTVLNRTEFWSILTAFVGVAVLAVKWVLGATDRMQNRASKVEDKAMEVWTSTVEALNGIKTNLDFLNLQMQESKAAHDAQIAALTEIVKELREKKDA